MKNLEITKQLVTPSIAKAYLEKNLHNRRISQPLLSRFVADMINGKWKEDTAEIIKFSETGKILDGQHRLLAVVKSGCSIYFHIAFNVDESVFDVLDTGKSRNASDCFMIAGIKQSNSIPSIIAFYNLLEKGLKMNQQIDNKATNMQLLNQYYENESFWQDVARMAYNLYNAFAKILPPSYIGGFYAHFYKLNPIKSEMFINQLCTGADISNPVINLLRNKLMQDKMALRKITPTLKMAFIIKTWNMFIMETEPKLLQFNSVKEEFPVAIKEFTKKRRIQKK